MQKCVVKNLKETNKLAKKFAKMLSGGDVVLLDGDLGAGKTTFTKALFKVLGVKCEVTSPTFNLLKEYSTKKLNLYHFDMYRIEDENEALEFGFNEYVSNTNSISVIEWFEKIKNLIPQKHILVKIKKIDENCREFEFYFNNKG